VNASGDLGRKKKEITERKHAVECPKERKEQKLRGGRGGRGEESPLPL